MIFQDYLKVPDSQQDSGYLEKPLVTSGRLSRISMIPEEDHDNFSDDEISIDVPSGSLISNMNVNGSDESLQTSKSGSINASIDTLDDKVTEGLTEDEDDDESSDSEEDYSESSQTDDEDNKKVIGDNNVSRPADINNGAIKRESKSRVPITTDITMVTGKSKGKKNVISNKKQKLSSDTNNVQQKQTVDIQKEIEPDETDDDSDAESIENDATSSVLDTDDNISDSQIVSVKTDNNLDDDNKRIDTIDDIKRDTFSDDHWEEISIDEDGVQTIVQENGDSKTEITIEVSRSTEKQTSQSLISDSNVSSLNSDAHINSDPENKYNEESSDEKRLKTFKATDMGIDIINMPKCTPSILVTQDVRDIKTERSDKFVKDGITNTDTMCDNEETDRGISVSNIVLDSEPVLLTPTIEYASISTKNNDEQDINVKTDTSSVNEITNIKHTASPTEITEDTKRTEGNDDVTDELSDFKVMNEHSDTRSLSPHSDIEYDYYNKRRGSQVKIKLEGRRRQRLSVSDCEPPLSPTESKHSDVDNNDVTSSSVSPQVPLLEKRERMEKITFKYIPEKQKLEPEVHKPPTNTVMNIHENKSCKSRENNIKSSNIGDNVNSSSKQKHKNIRNINSLNAELIAIYNSSVPDQMHHPSQHLHSDINLHVERKYNNEERSESSQLSLSRDQTRETKLFVTDTNQQTVKTGGQFETVTGSRRQDFNSDSTFNKFNNPGDDDSRKNGETKSSLLPNNSETGNCQIKTPKKCAIELDMVSHKCENKQLSLLQNGHKNNEIIEPASSIEQPLAPQHQLYQSKCLKKGQTYRDLYERECVSAPSVRASPKKQKIETEISRESHAKKHFSSCTERDFHLKASKLCLNDRSARSKFKTGLTSQQNETKGRRNLENDQTGSEKFEMSARALRSRDEQIEIAGFADREMSARLRRTESSFTDTARLRSIRKLLKLTDDIDDDAEDKDEETDEGRHSLLISFF